MRTLPLRSWTGSGSTRTDTASAVSSLTGSSSCGSTSRGTATGDRGHLTRWTKSPVTVYSIGCTVNVTCSIFFFSCFHTKKQFVKSPNDSVLLAEKVNCNVWKLHIKDFVSHFLIFCKLPLVFSDVNSSVKHILWDTEYKHWHWILISQQRGTVV